jgi:hypothetical protein
MVCTDSRPFYYEPVSAILIRSILNAMTILTAFNLRDAVVQGVSLVTPDKSTKKFIFTVTLFVFFLFLTVLTAYSFQNMIDLA